MNSTEEGNAFDISADDLLPPDESLDDDELSEDADEAGYSPSDWRSANLSWGFTPREAHTTEPLSTRLAREISDEPEDLLGDGIGDTSDTDGEIIDDQVGSLRAGRLVFADPDSLDPAADYWGKDIGIDGGAASAEEAAIHIVVDDDDDDVRWS
jgi:hypothetical protein